MPRAHLHIHGACTQEEERFINGVIGHVIKGRNKGKSREHLVA